MADLSHVATDDEAVKIAMAKASLGPAKSVALVLDALLARAKAAEEKAVELGAWETVAFAQRQALATRDARIKALEELLKEANTWVDPNHRYGKPLSDRIDAALKG